MSVWQWLAASVDAVGVLAAPFLLRRMWRTPLVPARDWDAEDRADRVRALAEWKRTVERITGEPYPEREN